MLKLALLAACLGVATTASAGSLAPSTEAGCQAIAAPDSACTPRLAESNDDAALSSLATPSADLSEWAPMRAAGPAFRDLATMPEPMLQAAPDHDGTHPLVPALLSLFALAVLLRKRPA